MSDIETPPLPEGGDTRWSIVHTRFKDPLDHLASLAPDEPFVQQMLATRERVRQQHDEILASVPDGLSSRERDEWVAARVLGSIVVDVADVGAGGSNP